MIGKSCAFIFAGKTKRMVKYIFLSTLLILNTYAFSQTFEEHLINKPIALPIASEMGDMDNDGDMDVVSVSRAGEVVLYENNGNNIFNNVVYIEDHIGINTENHSVAVGDINGDGLLDIVTAPSYPSASVFVYYNFGDFDFFKEDINSTYFSGSDTRMYIADIDSDNDNDIVTNTSGRMIILVNNGSSEFTEYTFIISGGYSYDYRIADLNGDNLLDVISASQNKLSYYIQGSNYSFAENNILPYGFTSLDIADIDSDGHLDIVASRISTSDIYLLYNDGSNYFTGNSIYTGTSVNLADMDGDGDEDLVYINSSDNQASGLQYRFSVILNDGTIDLANDNAISIADYAFDVSTSDDLSFGNMNNDAAADVLQTYQNIGRVHLFYSDMENPIPYPFDAAYSRQVSTSSGEVNDITVGDFDGDNDRDVLAVNNLDRNIELFVNNSGDFTRNGIDQLRATMKTEAVDLDQDGDLDFVVCGQEATLVYWFKWYENNGNGVFTQHFIYSLSSGNTNDVKYADFDNDGDIDILAMAHANSYVLYNDGNENFTEYQLPGLTYGPHTAEVYDFDNDGKLDIITADAANHRLVWLKNYETTFAPPQNIVGTTLTNIYDIDLGDLDNDGDFDIVVNNGSSVYKLINDGSLVFSISSISFFGISFCRQNKLADMTNDGYLDIVVGANQGLYLYKNDGSGGFSKKSLLVNSTAYSNPFSIQVEDFDADGDKDIIYGSTSGDRIAWLELTSFESTLTWTGSNNNYWSSSSNWLDSEMPISTDNVIIPNNVSNYPTITSATEINNLLMESNASLKGQENLSINGTLTIEREISGYSSNSDGWHFLSSPVSNQIILGSDFLPSSGDDLFEWAENTGEWLNYNGGSFDDTHFEVGKGYLVAYNSSGTKEFSGSFNTSSVLINLDYTAGMGEGWNLLGNPYPSAIDWDNIIRSGDIDNAVYIVDPTDGTYKSWNGSVGDITNGEIPVNQGFFVKANEGGTSVTMETADQVHSENDFNKDFESVPENTLKISLNGNKSLNNTYLQFSKNATEDFDSQSDAYKLFGFAEIPQVYTHLNDVDYSINSFNIPTEPVSIPLGIYLNAEEDLSFQFSGINTFNDNIRIELEDKLENQMINLNDQNTYIFRGTTSDEAERFLLHFSQVTGVNDIEAQDAQVYAANGRVYIRLEKGASYSQISIFDLSGRLMGVQNLSNQSLQSFEMSELKGIYLLQLLGDNNSTTVKVTL